MIIAFTGVVDVSAHDYEKIRSVVEQLKADQFVSGAAHGVDTYAARMAHLYFPEAIHTVIVPAAPHNTEFVSWAEALGFEIVRLKSAGNAATNYMNRNQHMVNLADELVAFPKTEEEQWQGSGTWATIRRARKKDIPIHLHPLTRLS